ncbi:MAG TPA: lytic murein transglycosylase, partial [Albitalea sp.]|nr:lytic murein transglycosylase [Albitalea sp.]
MLPRRPYLTYPLLAALVVGLSLVATPALAKKKKRPAAVRPDSAPDAVLYGQREDVLHFGAQLAERRGLDAGWVQAALGQSRYIPSVARFIMPPPVGSTKSWAAYSARFVEPVRLRAGAAFWDANAAWLRLAEERYGVPPEIIVGIVGVETIYGQQMGQFRIIDALATLSFDFPTGRRDRSAFFR